MSLAKKTRLSLAYIDKFVNTFGQSDTSSSGKVITNLYIAYSGGKDSAVVLDLAAQVADLPVIFNMWEINDPIATQDTLRIINQIGEYYPVRGIATLPPKSAGLKFAQQLGMIGQIDGSRISESERAIKSSTFIKNGKDVPRSELTWFIEKGIADMKICYPIYDWTDEDVLAYIKQYDLHYWGGTEDIWLNKK